MKALYRTVSALLAIASGVVIASLILLVADDRDFKAGWFAVFAVAAVLAGIAAVVLWSRALRK